MLVNQILLTLISINISQLKKYTKANVVWYLTYRQDTFLPPLPSPAEDAGCSAFQFYFSLTLRPVTRDVPLGCTHTAVTQSLSCALWGTAVNW